jgi:hypothetical protein
LKQRGSSARWGKIGAGRMCATYAGGTTRVANPRRLSVEDLRRVRAHVLRALSAALALARGSAEHSA